MTILCVVWVIITTLISLVIALKWMDFLDANNDSVLMPFCYLVFLAIGSILTILVIVKAGPM